MLRWLRRLFGRRDALGYADSEREIFVYWDGTRERKGDPLAIHRALLTMDPEKEFDIKTDPQVTAVPTIAGLRATGRLAGAVRKAFGIRTVDEGGLTDGECLRLFVQFGSLIRELQEDARPLANSPPPTAAAPLVGDCPTEPSPVSASMPSGSASGAGAT
jgi:hypothetical protein